MTAAFGLRMKLRAIALIGLLAVLASPRAARAESTVCRDGNLAVTGQHVYEVLRNCGAPSWSRWSTRTTEEWIYDLGDGSFPRLLRFQAGILVAIEILSGAR